MGIPCELISWQQCNTLCLRLAERVRASGFRPDIIVAIGRGGWVPGRLLSDALGLMDLTSFKIEHYHGPYKQVRALVKYPLAAQLSGRRVLLVDDVSDSGSTFAVALEHLRTRGTPAALRTAVMHYKIQSSYTPDFYAAKVVKWRWLTYPWALWEDLTIFVHALRPVPRDGAELARRLHQEHGIQLGAYALDELCRMMHVPLAAVAQSRPNNG